ncbi:DUF1778 domain-containing protein [Achromobacter insuavis]|uniref:type II toxin -antitoxin system TacA 1-like antitoxin n=1 Tax=Achromobacter insuavis TaxID=1287735 RepID=UPI003B8A94D5
MAGQPIKSFGKSGPPVGGAHAKTLSTPSRNSAGTSHLLVRAAELRGQTLEAFVIESLRLASEAEVLPEDVIHLSEVT